MTTAESNALLRSIADCPGLMHLGPPVAHPTSSLIEVVAVLAADPRPGVVFVTDAEDQLAGWIPERTLDADLLVMVLPGDVLRAVRELDVRDALRAARGLTQTARELVSEAMTVTPQTSLKDALIRMVHGETRVAALVDPERRLLGYVTLLDIMGDLLRSSG